MSYPTERMITDWLNILDEYWDERDTTYSDHFDLWPDWLYKYFNELMLGEAIENSYLMWKSEQHRLTPKYGILHPLELLVKKYLCLLRIMIINSK